MPKRPWDKQESRLAGVTGGTRNSGSGNGWVRKADVRGNRLRYLIEAKWTARKSFILKLADLKVLEHRAALEDREPAFCIEFSEQTTTGHTRLHRYVVVKEEHLFGDEPEPPEAC